MESEPILVPIASKPKLAQTPKWLKRKCIRLKPLNLADMSQEQVHKAWAKDIALYNVCASRHSSHVDWQVKRDKALMGK